VTGTALLEFLPTAAWACVVATNLGCHWLCGLTCVNGTINVADIFGLVRFNSSDALDAVRFAQVDDLLRPLWSLDSYDCWVFATTNA